ncbi:ABC transporter substrate binding protein [Butyrivibrio sp. AE3004]|uniref:ABC transporter substrate binding protein n=1 Tax=Butyrivibrio sp. AE3004 TaxID=1506994 RepID=UPI0004941FB9|nr:ABC transporter substrate binding protein [Butyrivibrio sp. AE3004]
MMKKTRFLCVLFVILMVFSIIPYGSVRAAEVSGDRTDTFLETAPNVPKGTPKRRFCIVSYDEYIPFSKQLYYILSGLESLGWIKENSIPFTAEDIEKKKIYVDEMYGLLQEADIGDYIEFSEGACYYLAYEDEDKIASDIKKRVNDGDIDFIITTGTSAGVFVKELGLKVPMVDFSATDPVSSGIIDSATEGTGSPYVWAQVEPSLPLRQLKYYHSLKAFDHLGVIIYGDETISGVPDIEASSKEVGFSIVKYNIDEQPRETAEERDAYYKMVEDKFRKMAEEDIDAFFLTVDLINDMEYLMPCLKYLYDKKIPVYLMDDVSVIESGALMLISANDMENVGLFVADVIARTLNGAEVGSLPCVYTSAPSIYVNYEIAREIGYPLSFEFLAACDRIFTVKRETP